MPALNRRDFLRQAGGGLGLLALASLLNQQGLLGAEPGPVRANPLAPKAPHFRARAKSVIWLFMEGGPSAVDTFDPKPELSKFDGRQPAIPIHTHFGSPGPLMKSPFSFAQYGQSGTWVCDQLPHLASVADELCILKSCWAESPNHVTALLQMNTGHIRTGFPSMGSWLTYGLGTENANLPGFVVVQNAKGTKGGSPNWGAGFLPNTYQATPFRPAGSPILNLHAPQDVTAASQRAMLDFAGGMNRRHLAAHPGNDPLQARIQSYELAFAMQTAASDAAELADESAATKTLYGLDHDITSSFGRKCLLARRLVARGVRFVQVYCDDEWDAHNSIVDNHRARCAETDRGAAALIKDLKQRGMLQDTLVIWGGEFGRMPVSESGHGRDHNPEGFLMWMAGGGVKGGMSYGATDEIGWRAADRRISVPDLHATILHTLGLDHEKLTYTHNGRKFRLTDVSGTVLHDILG